MFKKIILLLVLATLTFSLIGCSRAGDTISPEIDHHSSGEPIPGDGHYLWHSFRVGLNPADGTAVILPNRGVDKHFYINEFIKPPMCSDCVRIVGSNYLPDDREWQLTVQLRLPTSMTLYDVRGLVFNLGNKYLKNPDGLTKKYLPQDVSFKAFAKDEPMRAVPPGGVQLEETYIFHFPPTDDWQFVDYAVDISWPGNCGEPIIEDITFPSVLQIDVDEATLTATAFDHQDDFFIVLADLTPLGGDITPLYDYGQDNDGEKFDGLYGAKGIMASGEPGHYVIEVFTYDIYARYGYNSFHVSVVGETGNMPPVIDQITMSKTTCTKGDLTDKITLQCTAHDDDPGDVLHYDWSVTGGQLENEEGPSTVWIPPDTVGKYYVNCEVSDGNGGFDSKDSGKIRVTSYTIMNPAPAPGYSSERLAGEGSFDLSDYTPGNIVMMNFWSTLCGPCIAEFPVFMEIREHYAGQDFALILLDLDANKNTARNWIAGHDYEADEWGWDSGGSIFNNYKGYNGGTTLIPQTYLIDNDGYVRFAKVGAISHPSEYTDIIDELI